jgi:TPR repeat protein
LQFAETWFQLGLISPAEEVAYQILAEGKHPLVLLLLAKIHLVKNQTATARVFLSALEREPGCASWAKPYRNYLDHVSSPPVEEEIKYLRDQMFKGKKLMQSNTNSLSLLETILDENPKNRMAFEYWMAFNLLMLREKKLAVSFHLLTELGVPGNHRLYQQAYVLMRKDAPKATIDSIEIEPCTRELFARFTDAYNNRGTSEPLDAVYDFRNTYFYLDLFVESMRSR